MVNVYRWETVTEGIRGLKLLWLIDQYETQNIPYRILVGNTIQVPIHRLAEGIEPLCRNLPGQVHKVPLDNLPNNHLFFARGNNERTNP